MVNSAEVNTAKSLESVKASRHKYSKVQIQGTCHDVDIFIISLESLPFCFCHGNPSPTQSKSKLTRKINIKKLSSNL